MFLRGACLLLVGACIAGPPTVRGCIEGLWVRQGRAEQAPPLRWNYKMAIKISRILLRFMVGVGLCSTRGALRQHRALAGEQCSPLLYNRKGWGCFCAGLPFACRGLHCRPANGAGGVLRGCGCGEGGGVRCGCGAKRRGGVRQTRAEPSPAPTI